MPFYNIATLLCILTTSGMGRRMMPASALHRTQQAMELETMGCTEKSYYFQFAGEEGAAEMHSVDKKLILDIYPARKWTLSLPQTGKLWDDGASIYYWNKCWPQWWQEKSVRGCYFGKTEKIWKLANELPEATQKQVLHRIEASVENDTALEAHVVNQTALGTIAEEDANGIVMGTVIDSVPAYPAPKKIDLAAVNKITFTPKADEVEAVLTIDYSDASGAAQSLLLSGGKNFPESIVKALLREMTSHNYQEHAKERKQSFEGKEVTASYYNAPDTDEDLQSVAGLKYGQGAENWLQGGWRYTGREETGLISLVGGLTGGLLGLTLRAPKAIYDKFKDDKELKKTGVEKLWEKLSNCNTLFQKCGEKSLLVPTVGGEC